MAWNFHDTRFQGAGEPGRWYYSPETNKVYEMGSKLGQGGAANVFRCKGVSLLSDGTTKLDESTEYAAKIIWLKSASLVHTQEAERERQRREVQIMSKLHHPGIVNLFDVIETLDEIILIMELVPGGELFYKIIDAGAFSEDQTRYILTQLLPAIHYVHSKNVVHRDLKPENILISETLAPGFYRVKIADFGLAKVLSYGRPEARTFVGTPQYWAPEVLDSARSGQSYGIEADLWSLGCVIYVMLSGAYPFDARTQDVHEAIRSGHYHFHWPRFDRVSSAAKDLITGLLTVDRRRRLSITQAMNHPWITGFKLPPNIRPLPLLEPFPSSQAAPAKPIITKVNHYQQFQNKKEESHMTSNWKNLMTNTSTAMKAIKSPTLLEESSDLTNQLHFAIPEESEMPNAILRQEAKLLFPELYRPSDRPTDPNSRAIVPLRGAGCPYSCGRSRFPNHQFTNSQQSILDHSEIQKTSRGRLTSNVDLSDIRSHDFIPHQLPGLQPSSQQNNWEHMANSTEDELLSLQLSIIRKFHLAYIALRGSPQGAKRIAACAAEARDVQAESVSLMMKFETTCSSVLGILPDLSLAVSEKKVDLAVCLFEDIRKWVSRLQIDVDMHQKRVEGFITHVIDLVEVLRAVKATTDRQLMASVAFLETDSSRDDCEAFAMHYLENTLDNSDNTTLMNSVLPISTSPIPPLMAPLVVAQDTRRMDITQNLDKVERRIESVNSAFTESIVSESSVDKRAEQDCKCYRTDTIELIPRDIDTAGGSGERAAGSGLIETSRVRHEDEFRKWYEGIREAVYSQLDALGASTDKQQQRQQQAQQPTQHPTQLPSEEVGMEKNVLNEKPIMHDMTPAQVAHEFLDLLFVSPASWIEYHRRAATQKRLHDGIGENGSLIDSTSSSSDNIRISVDSNLKSSVAETTTSSPTSVKESHSWRDSKWARSFELKKIKKLQKDVYHHALRTSELLIKALDELRRIDQILRRSTSFWISLNTVIERLCQMKTQVERLLMHSTDSAPITDRFYERLTNYHKFLFALRNQARKYVKASQDKFDAMENFTVALTSMADRVDTANALFAGKATAYALQQARHRPS